jgi:hypothetical protein
VLACTTVGRPVAADGVGPTVQTKAGRPRRRHAAAPFRARGGGDLRHRWASVETAHGLRRLAIAGSVDGHARCHLDRRAPTGRLVRRREGSAASRRCCCNARRIAPRLVIGIIAESAIAVKAVGVVRRPAPRRVRPACRSSTGRGQPLDANMRIRNVFLSPPATFRTLGFVCKRRVRSSIPWVRSLLPGSVRGFVRRFRGRKRASRAP